MNGILKKVLFVTISLTIALPSFAGGHFHDPQQHKKKMEQIRAAKIAFFTSELDLTPKEAEQFWPIYNQYHQECVDARKNNRELYMEVKKCSADSTATTKDIVSTLDKYQSSLTAMAEIDIKYIDKFLKILPAQKVAKLICAEESFREQMIKMWRGAEGHPHPHKESKKEE